MSIFKRRGKWVSKFQQGGRQRWTPGGPWETRRQAEEADAAAGHETEHS